MLGKLSRHSSWCLYSVAELCWRCNWKQNFRMKANSKNKSIADSFSNVTPGLSSLNLLNDHPIPTFCVSNVFSLLNLRPESIVLFGLIKLARTWHLNIKSRWKGRFLLLLLLDCSESRIKKNASQFNHLVNRPSKSQWKKSYLAAKYGVTAKQKLQSNNYWSWRGLRL